MIGRIAFIAAFLFLNSAYAQMQLPGVGGYKTYDSKSFYISSEGERIECFGMIDLTSAGISYYTNTQNAQFRKYKEVKYLSIGTGAVVYYGSPAQLFINLPINDNRSLLHKIIAFNDKYILTAHFGAYSLDKACVFDWNGNLIENDIAAVNPKNNEAVLAAIKKYFPDCSQLSEYVNKNKTAKKLPLDNISLIKCGEREIDEFIPK